MSADRSKANRNRLAIAAGVAGVALLAYYFASRSPSEEKKSASNRAPSTPTKKKVLLIFPLDRDYLAIRTLPKHILDKYEFSFMDSELFSYSSRSDRNFSLVDFTQQCAERVRRDSIDLVMSTRDVADVVHAAMSEKFDHIPGPSVESAFLALFKPYTRLVLDPKPIAFHVLDMDSPQWNAAARSDPAQREQILSAANEVVSKLGGHGFLKPPSASCSSLVGQFDSGEKLVELIGMHDEHGEIFSHYLPSFCRQYLDPQKYELAFKRVTLAEQFMGTPVKVTVDGCVSRGQICLWGIVDSVYWTQYNHPECFIGCSMPSMLHANVRRALRERYTEVVGRLIDHGFDDQFVDVEFFVTFEDIERDNTEARIDLMEVNSRAFMQMTPIYRRCLEGGCPIETMLKLGEHQLVTTPLSTGVHGLNGYLNTLSSGVATELFDFEAAKPLIDEGTVILAVTPDQQIETVSSQGTLLAYANVFGENYDDCLAQLVNIGKKLIKSGAPWDV